MRIPIYLATQTFRDGRVMYRRCAVVGTAVRAPHGGIYVRQTPEATAWLQQAGMPAFEDAPNFAGLAPFEWVEA